MTDAEAAVTVNATVGDRGLNGNRFIAILITTIKTRNGHIHRQ